MITHANMISGQAHCDFYGYNYYEEDTYLSYVPLSHVYEQIMIGNSIIFGFKVGYTR
jgi:long-subunit acyl-CoA synthetase (AMP-forming)